jgi:hypothetical protein
MRAEGIISHPSPKATETIWNSPMLSKHLGTHKQIKQFFLHRERQQTFSFFIEYLNLLTA